MLGRTIWISAVAALVLPLFSAPSFADEPFRLFGCSVEDSESDFISLYGVEQEDGTWTRLQFLIAKNGIISALVPGQPLAGSGPFYFSNSGGPEGYYAQVRFNWGGRNYALHMLEIPPGPGEEYNMRQRSAFVRITEPNGAVYDLPCGAEIDEYIGYMQRAMNCDMTNRYGAAGCDFDVWPERAVDDKLPEGFAP
ncbi:hypothetical protein [Devosia sp.]|uniref:hypothetical protein n=1 Tax=Devosia sp. TaxID=1871048 RepID=UPI0026222269|nr:hypothetical protein [Devosia sp.]